MTAAAVFTADIAIQHDDVEGCSPDRQRRSSFTEIGFERTRRVRRQEIANT